MVKQRRMTKKNQTKRGDVQRQMVGAVSRYGLPQRYPSPVGDVIPFNMRASKELESNGGGAASMLIVLGRGTSTSSYLFLDDLIPGFGALCTTFSRFVISRIRVEARTTTNIIGGGFVGVNYEPTDSERANPPSDLVDVSNAVHYAMATPGAPAVFVARVSDYYNEWKASANEVAANHNANDTQMGVIQVYASGAESTLVGMLNVQVEGYFCGYRATA